MSIIEAITNTLFTCINNFNSCINNFNSCFNKTDLIIIPSEASRETTTETPDQIKLMTDIHFVKYCKPDTTIVKDYVMTERDKYKDDFECSYDSFVRMQIKDDIMYQKNKASYPVYRDQNSMEYKKCHFSDSNSFYCELIDTRNAWRLRFPESSIRHLIVCGNINDKCFMQRSL